MPKMDVSGACSQEKSVNAAALGKGRRKVEGVISGEADPTHFTTESLCLKQRPLRPSTVRKLLV